MDTVNAPRVYLLCAATWGLFGSLGWLTFGLDGLAAGVATASLVIAVANFGD